MSLKAVKKLQNKKYREESGCALVEGQKGMRELLGSSVVIESLYLTPQGTEELARDIDAYHRRTGIHPHLVATSEHALAESGTLVKNRTGLAVFRIPEGPSLATIVEHAAHEIVLVLDAISNPGNLGTIVRTADWFGIRFVVVSPTTVDTYSPKVLNATMGSLTRVAVCERSLPPVLSALRERSLPVVGATLSGTDLRTVAPRTNGCIVLGSESHGIEPDVRAFLTDEVTIPGTGGAESLNVGVAAGIVLSWLIRP